MKKLIAFLTAITIGSTLLSPTALAAQTAPNTHLVPCQQSEAFQTRMQNAPDNYYFDQPYQAYSANLLCGAEGLPHLQLRLDKAVDIAIPFGIFFYVAGFIGWSGRAYLIGIRTRSKPEESEIFIDLSLAAKSLIQALLWPLIAIKQLTTREFTAPKPEIYVSPR